MQLTDTQVNLILDVLTASATDMQMEILGYERSINIMSGCDMHKEAVSAERLLDDTRRKLLGVIDLRDEINRQLIAADLERSVTSNES